MDSGVSVSRHERPRAHHELALRSAGGAPAARALALLPLPLRLRLHALQPMCSAGSGPARWPSCLVRGGHHSASLHQRWSTLLGSVPPAPEAPRRGLQPTNARRAHIPAPRGRPGGPWCPSFIGARRWLSSLSGGAGFFGRVGLSSAAWREGRFWGRAGLLGFSVLPWDPLAG
jgi:hypothetical protein